jgi:DNA polymerase III alpha subunit
MIILAKNYDGYKEISKLSSAAFKKGLYYKPRIDDRCMEEIGVDNLIATSACVAGRIPRCILKDDFEGAKKWIAYYDKLFNQLLDDDNSYQDLIQIIHYIVLRVVKRNFKDKDGNIIENKFGYFKNPLG